MYNDRDKAILTFSTSGKTEAEKKAAILQLSQDATDELAIRSLILALGDKDVSESARIALERMLDKAHTTAAKETLMRHLTAFIFESYSNTTTETHLLLNGIIQKTIQYLPETDDLMAWMMLDAAKGAKLKYENRQVSAALADFFNRSFLPENQRSKRAFQEAGDEMVLRALLAPETVANAFLLQSLNRLHQQKWTEVSLEMVAASATLPFKVVFDKEANRNIIGQNLANLALWTSALKQTPNALLADYQQITLWLNQTEAAPVVLSEPIYRRIALNHLLVAPLVALLCDEKPNLADKGILFNILSNLHLSRELYLDSICTYLGQVLKQPNLDKFPQKQAVQFLAAHLVGLNRFVQLTEQEEQTLLGQNNAPVAASRRKLTDKSIVYAQTIFNTLLSIIPQENALLEARILALRTVVKALPINLLEILQNLKPCLEKTPKLRRALYEMLGETRFVEGLEWLRNAWETNRNAEHRAGNEAALVTALGNIGTSAILGHYQLANGFVQADFLLKSAFEEKDIALRSLIRNMLAQAGFQPEIDRETKRLEILANTQAAEKTATDIANNENTIKSTTVSLYEHQGQFATSLFWMSNHINALEMVCIDKKLDLLDVGIDIAKLQGQLTHLLNHSSKLETEIKKITAEISSRQNDANDNQKQLNNIKKSLESAESSMKTKQQEIDEARGKYSNAKTTIATANQEMSRLNTQINQTQGNLNTTKSQLQAAKRQEDNFKRQLSSLNNQKSPENSLDSEIQGAKSDMDQAKRKVSEVERQIASIESSIRDLTKQVRRQENVVSNAQSDLRNTENTIRTGENFVRSQQTTIDRLQREADPIPAKIATLQRQVRDYDTKLSRQVNDLEAVRREIRVLQQSLAQVKQTKDRIQQAFATESESEKRNVDKYKSNAQSVENTMNQENRTIIATQRELENNESRYQNQIQEQAVARRDYDKLGDTCYEQTHRAHEQHQDRSKAQKLERMDLDLRAHYLFEALRISDGTFGDQNKKAVYITQQKEKL